MHPIIALTANAVAGQEDVFLANGFDGFISKPIDMRQLNAAMKKFIRDKQSSDVIKVVRRQERDRKDQKAGISAQPQTDPLLAEFFVKDANRSVSTLDEIKKKNGVYEDEDLRMFITTVHAMKSALANVGELEVSSFAAQLEQAGRNNDIDTISSETPVFLSELRTIIKKLTPLENLDDNRELQDEKLSYFHEKLLAIKEACEVYDKRTIKEILTVLKRDTWPRQIKQLLDTMSEQLLDGDFEKVACTTQSWTNN